MRSDTQMYLLVDGFADGVKLLDVLDFVDGLAPRLLRPPSSSLIAVPSRAAAAAGSSSSLVTAAARVTGIAVLGRGERGPDEAKHC
jgi:hypothetical protein